MGPLCYYNLDIILNVYLPFRDEMIFGIITLLSAQISGIYLTENVDGGIFKQMGQWPERKKKNTKKLPHLDGYWDIRAIDHTQVISTFINIYIV